MKGTVCWGNIWTEEGWNYYYLFILTANGFLSGGSGTAIRHNTQITHNTQNNTTLRRNIVYKTTHTIKDTVHRMNTNNHNYNDKNKIIWDWENA
jgi:hypothetical protein